MRKQTKKILSMVLSAAMALSLTSGINFVNVSAEDETGAVEENPIVFDGEIDSWTYGGDPDCRLEIGNEWGNTAMPTSLAGLQFTGIQVTFTASHVAEALKAADKESVTAALMFNSSVDEVSNWEVGGPNNVDAVIEEDGTYTVSYAGFTPAAFAQYLAVRIPDLDSTVTQTGDGTQNVIEFSDVSMRVLYSASILDTTLDSWTYGGDPDCRLEIGNEWGNTAMPTSLAGLQFTGIQVTFTASHVAEALEAAGVATAAAALMFNSSVDEVSNWEVGGPNNVDAVIEEDGTYTVSYAGFTPAAFAQYLAVRIPDLDSTVTQTENGTQNVIEFSDVKINVFGYGVPGAIEPTPSPDPNAPKFPDYIDKDLWNNKQGIHAYIVYQTDTYDCRNEYKVLPLGEEYSATYIKAGGAEVSAADVDVQDALLTKDGEYTVAIDGIDLSNANSFNYFGIGTDLSDEIYPEVKITNASIKIDEKAVNEDPVDLVRELDDDYFPYGTFMAYNGGKEGYPLSELAVPTYSIEITFTVSGLSKVMQDIEDGSFVDPETGKTLAGDDPSPADPGATDKPSNPGATDKPSNPGNTGNNTSSTGSKTTTAAKTVGVAKGKTFTKGNFIYKVTTAATTKSQGKVTVSGLSKAGKKAKKLTVPATVKKTGTYKVTAIAKKSFKGAKATQITLGKNIKKIPAKAFVNCKKLKKLTLKAKLTSVAKKSFKGCAKKITVKGTSKKANVKKLKKSGYKKFK